MIFLICRALVTETVLVKHIGGDDACQQVERGDWLKKSGCVEGLPQFVLGLSNIGQMGVR